MRNGNFQPLRASGTPDKFSNHGGVLRRGSTPTRRKTTREPTTAPGRRLLADTHLLNDSLVPLGIVLLQIVEQAATPAHHHQESATRCMVLLVRAEMFGQLADALAEKGNLDFRAAGVGSVGLILLDDIGLLLSC